jgi:hypothetical protein
MTGCTFLEGFIPDPTSVLFPKRSGRCLHRELIQPRCQTGGSGRTAVRKKGKHNDHCY